MLHYSTNTIPAMKQNLTKSNFSVRKIKVEGRGTNSALSVELDDPLASKKLGFTWMLSNPELLMWIFYRFLKFLKHGTIIILLLLGTL